MGDRAGTIKGLSGLGDLLKARHLEQSVNLARQGKYLESAARFEQSGTRAGSHAADTAELAYAFYRRALSCQSDSNVQGAIRDLETAGQFMNLPQNLKSLIQERVTAIHRGPDAEIKKLDAAIAGQFEKCPSDVDMRGEFRRKNGLVQANRKRSVNGIAGISAVGVYRWAGDLNSNERWSQLIREFKRGDKELPAFFGRILADHVRATPMCRGWMREVDYIVPVAASTKRTAERGADIVARTGEHLSTRLGVPVRIDFLRRKANSERSRDVGKTALADQYTFNPKKAQEVRERVILLLDDVMARGHTAEVCASRLTKHGCAKVFLLVLALAESSLQSSRHS